jgi:hypothetical protein
VTGAGLAGVCVGRGMNGVLARGGCAAYSAAAVRCFAVCLEPRGNVSSPCSFRVQWVS